MAANIESKTTGSAHHDGSGFEASELVEVAIGGVAGVGTAIVGTIVAVGKIAVTVGGAGLGRLAPVMAKREKEVVFAEKE